MEPLRYLFLKPAYQKARFAYVTGLLLLYALLVAPGPRLSRRSVNSVSKTSRRRAGGCWLPSF